MESTIEYPASHVDRSRSSAPVRSAARSRTRWPRREPHRRSPADRSRGTVAEGKALDILQSAPVEQFATRVTAAATLRRRRRRRRDRLRRPGGGRRNRRRDGAGAAAPARAARDDGALPLCRWQQRELMMRAVVRSSRIAPARLVGSAPLALESAVTRDRRGAHRRQPRRISSIGIAGVPPRDVVIGWDAATAFHQPIAPRWPPHHLASVSARLPRSGRRRLHAGERRRAGG